MKSSGGRRCESCVYWLLPALEHFSGEVVKTDYCRQKCNLDAQTHIFVLLLVEDEPNPATGGGGLSCPAY